MVYCRLAMDVSNWGGQDGINTEYGTKFMQNVCVSNPYRPLTSLKSADFASVTLVQIRYSHTFGDTRYSTTTIVVNRRLTTLSVFTMASERIGPEASIPPKSNWFRSAIPKICLGPINRYTNYHFCSPPRGHFIIHDIVMWGKGRGDSGGMNIDVSLVHVRYSQG